MDTTFDLLDRAAGIELMRIAATGKHVLLANNEVRGMCIALAHRSPSFGRWSCLHIIWIALRANVHPIWKRQLSHFQDQRAVRNLAALPACGRTCF